MRRRPSWLAPFLLAFAACGPRSPESAPTEPATKPDDSMLAHAPPSFPAAIACAGVLDRSELAATPRGPVAHLVVALGPGSSCEMPAIAGVDAIVLALDGQASATVLGEEGSRDLPSWAALRVPGLGVRLTTRTVGLTLLVAIATDAGDDVGKVLVDAPAWSERPGPVEEASLRTSTELVWGAGGFRARIAFGAPSSPLLGLEVLRFAGDQVIAPHRHEAWEVITVLAGNGTVRIADDEAAMRPGQHVAIPPRTEHAARGGGEDVLVVQSYSPAGPEQRFVQLAADAATQRP